MPEHCCGASDCAAMTSIAFNRLELVERKPRRLAHAAHQRLEFIRIVREELRRGQRELLRVLGRAGQPLDAALVMSRSSSAISAPYWRPISRTCR
ncbi:hypothetical protein [uncultured Cloacibacillus sp.]|uniref:hypothetical protein n=1 Tax=uncultured Cloacibacillus sp. TaxID=889794 RepID=UPI003208D9F6